MKKIGEITSKNIKYLIVFLVGFLLVGGVTYADIKIQGINVGVSSSGLSSTDVQHAIDELYQKKQVAPDTPLKLGDYFTLVPDASSFTVKSSITGWDSDQAITPNELTLWRVINIQDDGQVEAVSEYVSSNGEEGVNFKGTIGYANFVGALQTMAASYAKAGYTTSTRMMGYGGQTATIADTSAFNGNYNIPPSTSSTSYGIIKEYQGGVTGDYLFVRDYQLVSKVYKSDTSTYGRSGLKAYKAGTTKAKKYWVSSRDYTYNSNSDGTFYMYFSLVYIDADGILRDAPFRSFDRSEWRDGSCHNFLRPIITLKSGVTLTGGSGTKSNPYTLG